MHPGPSLLWLGERHRRSPSSSSSPLQLLPLEVETNAAQSGSFMLKPVPFSPYHSPLLAFKSYR